MFGEKECHWGDDKYHCYLVSFDILAKLLQVKSLHDVYGDTSMDRQNEQDRKSYNTILSSVRKKTGAKCRKGVFELTIDVI